MNRILSAFAAACVLLSACETISPLEEQEVSAAVTNPSSSTSGSLQKDSVVFTADLGAQTKTYLEYDSSNGVYKLLWSESEQIIVWDYNTLSDEYSAKYEFCDMFSGAGTSTAQFIGSIEADRYVAIYANDYYFPIGGKPSIGLDTYQNYYAESISGDYPMIAVSDTRNFQFQNLCSILKVKVKGNGESLSQIKVTSKAGEPLSGLATVEFENDEPVLNFEEGYADVTLNCSSLTLSNEAQECYIVIPAQVYADGLELVFVTEDGQYMTVSTAKNIETKRSQMHEIAVSFEEDSLPDGMYVVGTVAGQPIRLVEDASISGRYDRFVVLDGNPFYIVKWEGGSKTQYDIEYQTTYFGDLWYEYQWGMLSESLEAGPMYVNSVGMYQIVLTPSNQMLLLPVNWMLRGSFNSWGTVYMDNTSLTPTSASYTVEDVMFAATPSEFKFEYSGYWEFTPLDAYGNVVDIRLITNLGYSSASGKLAYVVDNIPAGRGVYDISLNWNLGDGNVSEEFDYSLYYRSDLPDLLYDSCQLEMVGPSVAHGTEETVWNWGNALLAENGGYPSVDGSIYTWMWYTYLYDEDDCPPGYEPGFKVRTLNFAESGGIQPFDVGFSSVDVDTSVAVSAYGSNILVEESGWYHVAYMIDAVSGDSSLVIYQ